MHNHKSNILLLKNFVEDKRTSMEVYADNLSAGFSTLNPQYNIRQYRPATRFSKMGEAGKWQMRFARYMEYPAQVNRFKAHLYHITEHGYAHLIKNLPARQTLVTVHDLIPALKHYGAIKGVKPGKNPRLAQYSLSFLNQAAHLIAISENTKKDLIKYCNCRAENISVVYYGLPNIEAHQSLSKSQARAQLGLPDSPQKLVLVSGQEFYKNLETSVRVYNKLRQQYTIKLVHLGRVNSAWLAAKALADSPETIIELDQVAHADIAKLYKAVDCVLFPSWYEGFGLPPLEAMACGTPAVSSNVASLPEAVGDAALTVAPDDIIGLSQAVESVLFDEKIRQQLIDKGLIHSQRFNWTKCAQQTMAIYEKTLAAIN